MIKHITYSRSHFLSQHLTIFLSFLHSSSPVFSTDLSIGVTMLETLSASH